MRRLCAKVPNVGGWCQEKENRPFRLHHLPWMPSCVSKRRYSLWGRYVMRNLLDSIPRQIKTYVATVLVTLFGYAGLTCSSNCIQCYACLPLGALVLGSVFSKNIKARFQRFSEKQGNTPEKWVLLSGPTNQVERRNKLIREKALSRISNWYI